MSPPSHICPKCHKPQGADAFVNEKGKPAKWCFWCRTSYRDRLTNLHQRDATKPKREEAIDATSVAKQEGYANHPLANLLALSHIAGAKRALAIRDGNSWRGKTAWRAYYEAKRELAKILGGANWVGIQELSISGPIDSGGAKAPDLRKPVSYKFVMNTRDPNSSGVS